MLEGLKWSQKYMLIVLGVHQQSNCCFLIEMFPLQIQRLSIPTCSNEGGRRVIYWPRWKLRNYRGYML